jgi:hypothetical protein
MEFEGGGTLHDLKHNSEAQLTVFERLELLAQLSFAVAALHANIFICRDSPISLRRVRCGKDGKGYDIDVPNWLLKTIAPALKFVIFLVKHALTCQSIGSLVPFELIPNFTDFSKSDLESFQSCIEVHLKTCVEGQLFDKLDIFDQFLIR